jgi:hypothetical protein
MKTEARNKTAASKSEEVQRLRMMAVRSSNRLPGAKKAAHYSDEWFTPPAITQALGIFDLDPAAGPMNHAVRNLRLIHGEDGLERAWEGRVWLNPPYSNVHLWLEKMIAHRNGIALVNARPETNWFQNACESASAVLWLKGRVKFQRPDNKPTHPPVGCVLIAYGRPNAQALMMSGLRGLFMRIHRRSAR